MSFQQPVCCLRRIKTKFITFLPFNLLLPFFLQWILVSDLRYFYIFLLLIRSEQWAKIYIRPHKNVTMELFNKYFIIDCSYIKNIKRPAYDQVYLLEFKLSTVSTIQVTTLAVFHHVVQTHFARNMVDLLYVSVMLVSKEMGTTAQVGAIYC